jgi:hypothetical protein
LSVREILRGQLLALGRQLLGPLVAVLVVEFMLMLASITEAAPQGYAGFAAWLWLAGIAMLLLDMYALYWVAMWLALVSRNPNRVAGAALIRIAVLPWVAYCAIALLISLSDRGRWWEPSKEFFLGLWFLLGLVADFIFARLAREKLLTQFRAAAAQRYAPRLGFWKRLAGDRESVGSVKSVSSVGA